MKTYYSLLISFFLITSAQSQTITAISPATGSAGTTVTAIVTGQNTFFLSSSPQGIQNFNLNLNGCRTIYGTNFINLNEDSVQVDIPIPAGYVNGVYNVSVLKATGQTMTLPASFTITGGVNQNIQGFTPSTAVEGTTINAQITGQNLQAIAGMPGFQLYLWRGQSVLTPTNLTVISPGQINADFVIPPFTDTGYYECRINVTGNCFVLPNALHVGGLFPKQLVSIDPDSAVAGSTITALVTGLNTFFMSASPQGIQQIKLENNNCNIYYGTAINVIDNDHLDVTFTFPADASNGLYDLTVTLDANQEYLLPSAFTIYNGIDRSVSSFSPNTAIAPIILSATIDGLGLADIIAHGPVTITLTSSNGFVVTSTNYSMSGNQLLADFNFPPYCDNGFYQLDIISGSGCYSVINAVQISGGLPPAIISINPNQGYSGTTLTALMTGQYSYFMTGTQTGGISNVYFLHTTGLSSFNVSGSNITYIDTEHVNLNITIPPGALVGWYNVTVFRIGNTPLYLDSGFYVLGPVSVDEISTASKRLVLYPNPSIGPLYLELSSGEYVDGTILIVDQTGRELRRVQVRSQRGEIDLGRYPPGIYTVVLMNKEGIFRGKVIIQ